MLCRIGAARAPFPAEMRALWKMRLSRNTEALMAGSKEEGGTGYLYIHGSLWT